MLHIEARKNIIKKRIGSTTYEVAVFFNQNSRESMNDKMMRLVRNETQTIPSEYGTMEVLQMDRLPERGSL